MPMNKQVELDQILPLVRKPGRYIGGELNSVGDAWEPDNLNFCLIFPDLYEIGMSHQGLQILYHILNQQDRIVAHRCYTPDIDMEEELRNNTLPLFSLEARVDLSLYDALGITLPYELCFTNILTILDLAAIPFYSKERTDDHPLVLGGGSCAFNPEPVADFFDAIVIGDGEEIIVEIAETLLTAKDAGLGRQAILERLAAIQGVYVPVFFEPEYAQGNLVAVKPLKSGYEMVRRRVVSHLQEPERAGRPLVPIVKPVHDRLGLEIARGCTRGCRFCQAGMIYRPVRERSMDEIMQLAEEGIVNSGFDELALLSLSTGDYSCLSDLMIKLMDRFVDEYVSVSMPSMRVGTLTPEIMNQIKRVRKTGFTVAPEAGTDRLREVINKGITEADLLKTCQDAFALGWNLMKLYFMIGLPTETLEDVDAIVELAQKARFETGRGKGGRAQINVSVATYVPKPHTPFQWEAQLSLEESQNRINRLKKKLPRKGFKLKWHDPYQSMLEGVFSRGDRRLSRLIEAAWEKGVRLDGWSEHFRLDTWQQAAGECDIDLDGYLAARPIDAVLPWDHLDSGVDRDFFKKEHALALERGYTPDCRTNGCQQCGLCDFKSIQPVVNSAPDSKAAPSPTPPGRRRESVETVFTYRVQYSRLGDSRFYGHLELLQLVFRVLQRSGVPVLFSQGFNPSPRVSFSQALPVGVESQVEYFDMDLARLLKSSQRTIELLNQHFPAGIRVTAIALAPGSTQKSQVTRYEVVLGAAATDSCQQVIDRFFTQEDFIVERVRKRKRRELDLRPLVSTMELAGEDLILELISHHSQAATNPREVLEKVLGFSSKEAVLMRVRKVRVEELDHSEFD